MRNWCYTLCGNGLAVDTFDRQFLSLVRTLENYMWEEAHRTDYLFSRACPCSRIKKYPLLQVKSTTTANGTTLLTTRCPRFFKFFKVSEVDSTIAFTHNNCASLIESSMAVFVQSRKFKLSLVSVFYLKSSN